MDFDGEEVRAGLQQRRIDLEAVECRAVVGRGDGGQCGVGYRAGRHVVAEQFRTVQINHGAIVAFELEGEVGDAAGVVDDEGAPEIDGGVAAAGRPAVDDRGFAAVSKSQFRRPGRPGRIVEGEGWPGGGLSEVRGHVAPGRAGRHQRDGHSRGDRLRNRDGDRRRRAPDAAAGGRDGGKRVPTAGRVAEQKTVGRQGIFAQLQRAVEELDVCEGADGDDGVGAERHVGGRGEDRAVVRTGKID